MKQLLTLIALIFFFSFTYCYLRVNGFSGISWEGVVFLPMIFIIGPAMLIGLLLAGIWTNCVMKILLWTHRFGLLVIIIFNLFELYFKVFPDYSSYNEQLNEQYLKTYDDKRDSVLSLAYNQLKRKKRLTNGFGILSIKSVPKDTSAELINEIYQVAFVYFVGHKNQVDNCYVTAYQFSNKSVDEILDRKAVNRDFVSLDSTLALFRKTR